jgi:predicted MFS family arabinose efflux permease
MADYPTIFGIALVICATITFLSSDYYKQNFKRGSGDSGEEEISPEMKARHNKLLKKYLFVYLFAVLSDWLQGPYVYALYMEYGFKKQEIAQLFVAGFGSSMVFGSFIGGMADWGGRRKFVIIFAAVYAASCVTKREFFESVLWNVDFSNQSL